MNHIPVYILAGGKSSRFGSDKARAMLNGESLIKHVRSMLEPIADSVTVVAERANKYADLGLRTIADLHPGLGPLGGLQTALNDLPVGDDWLLLCPCDALVIETRWVSELLKHRNHAADAVAFHGNYWQPMPAAYARSSRTIVGEQIDTDRLSMQDLLNRLNTVSLPLPLDWPHLWQANRPSDLNADRNGNTRSTGTCTFDLHP